MDVDKIDYLIRDSYFVGLKYGFDLEHFLRQIAVCGGGERLEEYRLVLDDTVDARISTELFLLIWKSLYDLVYHVESSRIAEKMLEKAILVAIETEKDFMKKMRDLKSYVQISEHSLLESLKSIEDFPRFTVNRIDRNELYRQVFMDKLEDPPFKLNENFLESLRKHDLVSESITQKFNESESEPYNVICDIIRTKVPKDIFVNRLDKEGEPLPIESNVIDALKKEELLIKVYVEPTFLLRNKDKVKKETVKKKIQQIIDGWEKSGERK